MPYVVLEVRCKIGHIWDLLAANYFFNLNECRCPICKGSAKGIRLKNILEQLPLQAKETDQDEPEQISNSR